MATGSRRIFICFIGIDGAGKTTCARRVIKLLEERNIKVKFVWNKYEPWTLKPVMKLGQAIFLRGKDMFRDYDGYQKSKQKAFRTPVIPTLFRFLYFVEYPAHVFFKIGLPLLMNKSVVCDRYFYDMVAGTSAEFGFSEKRTTRALGVFTRLLPKPDLIFLIDAPEEVAFKRKNDIPSVDFLKIKRGIYLRMASQLEGINIIDGCRDLPEIDDIIFEKVIGRIKEMQEH